MIRAIVVDDEMLAATEISTMVQETGYISITRTYDSPLKALDEIEKVQPQVAFVDIGMPEMEGMIFAEKALEKDPSIQIVFITAYNQYAVQAFELNALDYLLKPTSPQRVLKTVKKVAKAISLQPKSQGRLEIQCFGNLNVRVDGERVKWGRAKAEELFCYLLINHGQGVHKEVILDVLWPDYDVNKSLPILQTSICKLRNIFAPLKDKVKISYASNRYCLKITGAQCDLFIVNDVLKGAAAKVSQPMLERAAEIVAKGFVPEQGYLWASEKEEGMKTNICTILKIAANADIENGKWEQGIRKLRLYMEIVPFDEAVSNQLIECYSKINDGAGLVQFYQWLEHTLDRNYDMVPPPSTRELYNQLAAVI